MGKLRVILMIVVLVGGVCPFSVQAQQQQGGFGLTNIAATTPGGQVGPGLNAAIFHWSPAQRAWANTASRRFRVSGLPPGSSYTLTVRYTSYVGNNRFVAANFTSITNFWFSGQPPTLVSNPITLTLTNNAGFTLNFGRIANVSHIATTANGPMGRPGHTLVGSYDFNLSRNGAAVGGRSSRGVIFDYNQTQQQAQNQNQGGSQQNQNQFPGPQQQNAGIGTRISGRPSLIIRKTIHRTSGRAGKGNNMILPTHAQRRNYMNYANGNSMNRRQTLRNYRGR